MSDLDRHALQPLLDRVLAGDPQAFNDLFAQLRPHLHALVRRTLGPQAQGPLDHSNLVQSSLRRIYENFDQLREDPSVPRLLAWIGAIVRNRIVDALRRQGREPADLPGSAIDNLPERLSSNAASQRDRRAARLAAALERLPERERLAVALHWFDRLPDSVIAERLGGSVGALRVLRCRALRKLKSLLEADHDDQ
jgi:RNA polymerase sigma-70 factor (ECF subfamily)